MILQHGEVVDAIRVHPWFFIKSGFEAVLEFVDLFDFLDEAAEGAGADGLAGVIADAFLRMDVGFNAKSIGSIGHGGQGAGGDVFNVTDGVGRVHDDGGPAFFFEQWSDGFVGMIAVGIESGECASGAE